MGPDKAWEDSVSRGGEYFGRLSETWSSGLEENAPWPNLMDTDIDVEITTDINIDVLDMHIDIDIYIYIHVHVYRDIQRRYRW